jgi:hypothetical protein
VRRRELRIHDDPAFVVAARLAQCELLHLK